MNLDDLELELRKLPGVRAAGFTERDDVLLIQLQVSGDTPPPNLPLQATRIAYRHSEKPVALEVVRWRVVAGAARPAPRRRSSPLEGALGSMAGIEPIDRGEPDELDRADRAPSSTRGADRRTRDRGGHRPGRDPAAPPATGPSRGA